MGNAFLARLRMLTALGEDELDALAALLSDARPIAAERQLVGEGGRPERLHVLLDGWAARVKNLPDGRRHFCTVLVPGDLCDVDGLHVRAYDYGVVALTPIAVATIDRRALLALCEIRPEIARALTWLGFVDNSMLAESTASLARRTARERLIHLFCELMLRLAVVGRTRPDGYDLPVTQEKLADATGLTPVHVNRTLQEMRNTGLIGYAAQRLTVPDWDSLKRAAGFSPGYLHLEGMRRA